MHIIFRLRSVGDLITIGKWLTPSQLESNLRVQSESRPFSILITSCIVSSKLWLLLIFQSQPVFSTYYTLYLLAVLSFLQLVLEIRATYR